MRPYRALAIALASCVSMATAAAPGERPRCPVYRLVAAPEVDGDVRGDAAWRAIPGATGFCKLGAGYTVAKQSTLRIGWTDKALYVAMDCEEPDAALIADKRADGDRLWLDNGVEMFIEAPGNQTALQLIVNSAGARVVGPGWNAVGSNDWRAAAVKGQDFWSMEAEVPFACLRATPSAGAEWRGAVCRNIWEYTSGGDKFTTWPPLQNCFREPESFAVFEFRGESLSPEQAARIGAKLNLPYRRHLFAQVEELARTGKEYEAPIARAAGEAIFEDEARELNRVWTRIAALARDSASAPLTELRKLIAMADDLTRRSYELKYRFLIEQLLAE